VTGLSQTASPLSVSSLAQLTFSLLAIVALIVAVSWALKRLKMAGPRGRGEIAVIDELALGPRERIVLLRVGESQVLVGIGAGGVVGLTPLAVSIAVKAGGPAPAFADRLREFMKRPGSSA
jgi:flagellar protein FliO/FliZ